MMKRVLDQWRRDRLRRSIERMPWRDRRAFYRAERSGNAAMRRVYRMRDPEGRMTPCGHRRATA